MGTPALCLGSINFFHINFLCRHSSPGLSLGQTGFVPGTSPVKSGFHCVEQGEFLGLSLFFTGFVPGANWVCPWDKSGENWDQPDKKNLCLCAFLLPERGGGGAKRIA